MISKVVMPQMSADMTEGTVVRWLKKEGDPVERGEIIAEIETDKANVEIEAFESGVFLKVLVQEGETVAVGTLIAVIASPVARKLAEEKGIDLSQVYGTGPHGRRGQARSTASSALRGVPPAPGCACSSPAASPGRWWG